MALLVVLLPVTVLCMPLVIPVLVPEATVSAAAIAPPLVLGLIGQGMPIRAALVTIAGPSVIG